MSTIISAPTPPLSPPPGDQGFRTCPTTGLKVHSDAEKLIRAGLEVETVEESDLSGPLVVGNKLFFKVNTGNGYDELWASDGSAAGTRLVASRALAEELGIARNSVLYAYEQLASEGYVWGDRRGTVVAAIAPDRKRDACSALALPGLSRRARRTARFSSSTLRAFPSAGPPPPFRIATSPVVIATSPPTTSSASTASTPPGSTPSRSCCTTTSRRSRPVK